MLKIWLDDERLPPKGWIWCKTAPAAISFLQRFGAKIISLDHDLGDEKNGNGNDVLVFIEEMVHINPDYFPPEIQIHTANPSARTKMTAGLEAIKRKVERKCQM